MDERVQKYEQKMTKTLEGFETELTTIRAGRANPHILDKITVDYYGSPTPLQQVANVTVPEARMIQIQPWESSLIKGIEKAILTSDLGLNPSNDGKIVRLVLPELTEERRKDLVKDVKKKGEAAKVAVRNIRRANLESICDDIKDLGVKYLTVYAFSTENWKRSREEVEGLMKLFRSYLKKCMKSAEKNHMRVKIIGDPTAFDQDIQDKIRKLEEFSKDYDELYFQIALNYGSRDEITRGMRKLAQDVAAGSLNPQEITEDTISGYLDTAGVPDPDLLIRTSGEQRLSNFLMWQLAYTEFYFTDVAWPDFHKEDLIRAIEKYNGRDRRYGGVKEE